AQHRRRKRTEALAILDPQVERLLHVGAARVGDDRAGAERARAELHAALEPADRVAGDETVDGTGNHRVVRAALERGTGGCEPLLDLALSKGRTEIAAGHGVGAVAAVHVARLAGVKMIGRERSADGSAGVACRRLNPDALEGAVAQQLAVAHAVERDTPG